MSSSNITFAVYVIDSSWEFQLSSHSIKEPRYVSSLLSSTVTMWPSASCKSFTGMPKLLLIFPKPYTNPLFKKYFSNRHEKWHKKWLDEMPDEVARGKWWPCLGGQDFWDRLWERDHRTSSLTNVAKKEEDRESKRSQREEVPGQVNPKPPQRRTDEPTDDVNRWNVSSITWHFFLILGCLYKLQLLESPF